MKRYLAILFCALLPEVYVHSQSVLSLDSCRQLAISNNKQLGVARMNMEIASNNVMSARTKYFPHVDAVAGYELMSKEISILSNSQKDALNNLGSSSTSQIGGKLSEMLSGMVADGVITPQMAQFFGQRIGSLSTELAALGDEFGSTIRKAFRTNTRNMFAGSVVVTQPIYMGGGIKALNRIAELNQNIAGDNYDLTLQNLLYETDAAYWLVVSLKQKQQLAKSYLDLVKKLNEDVEKMIREGVATRADGLNVEVRVNEAEMSKMRVDDNLTLSKMLLCQICGLPMDSDITLADEGRELGPSSDPIFRDTPLMTARPELRMLHSTVAITEQSQRIITATHYRPQIALTGGYLLTNPNVYNGFQHKFSGMWNIGLTVRMPLWDWRDGHYKLSASRAATTISELERHDMEEKINLQVEQERFKLKEANHRLELATKHVASAEENLRCANVGFREGVTSLSDVMAAQTAWEAAHTQKIDAEIEVQLSLLGLRKAMGQL